MIIMMIMIIDATPSIFSQGEVFSGTASTDKLTGWLSHPKLSSSPDHLALTDQDPGRSGIKVSENAPEADVVTCLIISNPSGLV